MPRGVFNLYSNDQHKDHDRYEVVQLISGQPPQERESSIPDPGKDAVNFDVGESRRQVALLLVVDVDVQKLVIPTIKFFVSLLLFLNKRSTVPGICSKLPIFVFSTNNVSFP